MSFANGGERSSFMIAYMIMPKGKVAAKLQ
jgi:hypothetical protein